MKIVIYGALAFVAAVSLFPFLLYLNMLRKDEKNLRNWRNILAPGMRVSIHSDSTITQAVIVSSITDSDVVRVIYDNGITASFQKKEIYPLKHFTD